MDLFYRSLGFIYLCSFSSLYSQWPGLYGWNGLLPVDQFLDRVQPRNADWPSLVSLFFSRFPSLVLFSSELGVSPDGICEFLLVVGIFLSFLAVSGHYNWLSFSVQYLAYLSLYLVGQTFMSFQWDILLLEVGFLSAIGLLLPFQQYGGQSVICLLLRFIFWKLMFMAGVVKIFADCPTWLQLTALEYHFATQPLATPISWYAHQLHPVLLRVGVVATLLIEVPFTFLSLGNFVFVRRVGVVGQALLQLMIIATGNYNFFNFLTLALMIPVWMDESEDVNLKSKKLKALNDKNVKLGLQKKGSSGLPLPLKIAIITTVVATMTAVMFDYRIIDVVPGSDNTTLMAYLDRIQLKLSSTVPTYLPKVVRYSGLVAGGAVLLKGSVLVITQAFSSPYSDCKPSLLQKLFVWAYRCIQTVFLLTFMFGYLWLSMEPLSQIRSLTLVDVVPLSNHAKSELGNYVSMARPFGISSGYGLFRMMTGVGVNPTLKKGIGGVTIPVVARPEIIIEGFDRDDQSWKNIPFRHKPTDVMSAPTFVAPHQPRLDWQMWFAALGNYQSQPWLINLLNKLLIGGSAADDVIQLLNTEKYPFPDPNRPPLYIRATLYHYDFSRTNQSWVRELKTVDSKVHVIDETSSDPQPWWTRQVVGEYIMPLERNNPSVSDFLSGYGIPERPYQTIDEKYSHCLKYLPFVQALSENSWGSLLKNTICKAIKIREYLYRI